MPLAQCVGVYMLNLQMSPMTTKGVPVTVTAMVPVSAATVTGPASAATVTGPASAATVTGPASVVTIAAATVTAHATATRHAIVTKSILALIMPLVPSLYRLLLKRLLIIQVWTLKTKFMPIFHFT
jgi:hypothetical protein